MEQEHGATCPQGITSHVESILCLVTLTRLNISCESHETLKELIGSFTFLHTKVLQLPLGNFILSTPEGGGTGLGSYNTFP